MLALLFLLVLHVPNGGSIQAALDSARTVYAARGEQTTIYISPGTYAEQLTIDIPGLRLINAAPEPSIALSRQGRDCDPNAVRITWHYGHGYQYRSMGDTPNYGGSRTRRWNATVLVTAPDFYAENIIFENSFNLYVSEREAADSLTVIDKMPVRPKQVGSTEVQQRLYRERAAAISFTETAKHAHLTNCRAVGRQDVLYGDQGASVYWQGGILQGGVNFIFGGLTLAVDQATIVANINGEKDDRCYISAGRSGGDQEPPTNNQSPITSQRGLLFYRCHIRLATDDELQILNQKSEIRNATPQVWLARPWRWWGETVWAYTTWDEGILVPEAWSTGLTKGQACPNSYEYCSQDHSAGRPEWVTILQQPVLPDGQRLIPTEWIK